MKKGMGWPIGIVAILLATVASNVAVILITRDDPSFAVEPDYYRKAVEWDSTAARRARSDALSWQVRARVAPAERGATRLSLDLTDEGGMVVQGAALAGSLLHIARAADVQAVTFTQAPNGAYEATVPMTRDGVWELRLTADRGNEHFVHTLRVETGLPGANLPAPENGGP